MPVRTWGVLGCTLLVLAMSNSLAQVRQSREPENLETLDIEGVQLALGMEQNSVLQKFREKELGIVPITQFPSANSTSWIVCQSPNSVCDAERDKRGQITFKSGRLGTVIKTWAEAKTAPDAITALYGAIRDLERRGLTRCQLVARENVSPGAETKTVRFVCGEHMAVSITLFHSAKTPFGIDVNQELWADTEKLF